MEPYRIGPTASRVSRITGSIPIHLSTTPEEVANVLSTVLVVDGDRTVIRSVEGSLRRAGYQVLTATHGEQAVRFASQRQVDLTIIGAPHGLEPLSLMAKIRAAQPSSLRVIISSAEPSASTRQALSRGDVLRVLRSPFNEASLLSMIDEVWAFSRKMSLFTASQMQSVRRLEAQMLESCFQNRLLRVAMQPVVEIDATGSSSGAPVAYEALLRSDHPILNSPRAVLKVAECRGRVPELGKLVFAHVGRWAARMPDSALLFVNLHADQLNDSQRLRAHLAPLHQLAHRIVLEINESASLDLEAGEPRACVQAIHQLGFATAVDDVGLRDNHLALLADLKPTFLKLPIHLVRDIDTEPRKRRMVELLFQIASSTSMKLVAKGVETSGEAEALAQIGLTWMMGYHFGRPALPPVGGGPASVRPSLALGA